MFSSNTSQVSSGGYEIQRSLRFNSADSAYLNRTPSTAGNRRTWTWSAWVKRGTVDANFRSMFSNGNAVDSVLFFNDNSFAFQNFNASSYGLRTTQVFRDPSAWYHLIVAMDTTQATASNRIKIYVNGVQVTDFAAATYPSQNYDTGFNTTTIQYLGFNEYNYFNGYMTEVNFIDGQALTPSSFGAFDAQTGVWGPTRYGGSYGTNGFYLNFSDNSNTTAATLGRDYSGNSNNWTPNNFSVSAGAGNDSLVDVPTNWGTDTGVGGSVRGNYCTLNPLYGNPAPTNGNLDISVSTQTGYGSMSFTSGKWYWEVTPTALLSGAYLGVMDSTYIKTDSLWSTATAAAYVSDGSKYGMGGSGAYGASYTNNDVIGFALDLDAGTMVFYKNGTSQGTAFTGMTGREWRPMVYGAAGTYVCNFGQRPFAYTAPSGFRALNTQNLPTPTIGATTATQANKYFDVVLRNGGGPSGSTYSTTINMANGALLWDKPRNQASDNYLVDSVRGLTRFVSSNQTSAEVTIANWFTGFNNGSFTTGTNDWGSGVSIVDWIWAANGAGVTNTAGSVTTTVSANTTAGFSVARGTLPSSGGASYGHGLGVAPSFIFAKCTSTTSDWFVYHASLGFNQDIRLNTTAGASSTTFTYNSANSSTVTIGGGNVSAFWGANSTWVWYNFAEVPGYSRFGTYTGNNSTDGPFVFCGFRPAYILIKRSSVGGTDWNIYDTTRIPNNVSDDMLFANLSAAELANEPSLAIDILSNGFKVRTTGSSINDNGGTMIFAAFASAPQKFALAR